MGIILADNKKDAIRILKDNDDHIFKVTKEVIYSIPKAITDGYSDYNNFLKFVKEHPNKIFRKYYHILTEIKKIKELQKMGHGYKIPRIKAFKNLMRNIAKSRKNKSLDRILFYLRKEENGWLGNLERAEQIIDSVVYRSNEDYYQVIKGRTKEISDWIKDAPSPYLAMVVGHGLRKKEMKENWDEIKVDIMLKGLRAKFSQNKYLKEKLLATGNATLHEDSPTDMFWGVKGKDMLGKLLMKVREELR